MFLRGDEAWGTPAGPRNLRNAKLTETADWVNEPGPEGVPECPEFIVSFGAERSMPLVEWFSLTGRETHNGSHF
ncbi:MAG: hypothetical protein R3B95_18265 [Nitrospirales bacterium]|nr:hypothetical protein [Nitrospirales bacterium]